MGRRRAPNYYLDVFSEFDDILNIPFKLTNYSRDFIILKPYT